MQFSLVVTISGIFTSVSCLKAKSNHVFLVGRTFPRSDRWEEVGIVRHAMFWGAGSCWSSLAGLALYCCSHYLPKASLSTLLAQLARHGPSLARAYPSFGPCQALVFHFSWREEPRVSIFCFPLYQGSYTRGLDPNYACKLLIPIPKMTEDGKRMRVKNQKWKLRTKVGPDGIGGI